MPNHDERFHRRLPSSHGRAAPRSSGESCRPAPTPSRLSLMRAPPPPRSPTITEISYVPPHTVTLTSGPVGDWRAGLPPPATRRAIWSAPASAALGGAPNGPSAVAPRPL